MSALDYPCVRLKGKYHITINSNTCLCGEEYQYGTMNMNNKYIVTKPLHWLTLDEITCCKCKEMSSIGK